MPVLILTGITIAAWAPLIYMAKYDSDERASHMKKLIRLVNPNYKMKEELKEALDNEAFEKRLSAALRPPEHRREFSKKGPWKVYEQIPLPDGQSVNIRYDDDNEGKLQYIRFPYDAPKSTLKDGEQYETRGGISQSETDELMKMWGNAVEVPGIQWGYETMVTQATTADAENWVKNQSDRAKEKMSKLAEGWAKEEELEKAYAEGTAETQNNKPSPQAEKANKGRRK